MVVAGVPALVGAKAMTEAVIAYRMPPSPTLGQEGGPFPTLWVEEDVNCFRGNYVNLPMYTLRRGPRPLAMFREV
jgi:hypothetical protein